MSTEDKLNQLRALAHQLMPGVRDESPLVAWMIQKTLLVPGGNEIENEIETERFKDIIEFVDLFKSLDEKLTVGEKLPKEWRPKSKKKRYEVSLIYQLTYKKGPSVQLDTADECAAQCEAWERQGLKTGWLPQVDRAPLKELVGVNQYCCNWQAPDGMTYRALMPCLIKVPRVVTWTSPQRVQRYLRDVQFTATGVVSGYLNESLKSNCLSDGHSQQLDMWIHMVAGSTCIEDTIFRNDVRGVLVSRGFNLEDFDSWKETEERLSIEPRLSETNDQVTATVRE